MRSVEWSEEAIIRDATQSGNRKAYLAVDEMSMEIQGSGWEGRSQGSCKVLVVLDRWNKSGNIAGYGSSAATSAMVPDVGFDAPSPEEVERFFLLIPTTILLRNSTGFEKEKNPKAPGNKSK